MRLKSKVGVELNCINLDIHNSKVLRSDLKVITFSMFKHDNFYPNFF